MAGLLTHLAIALTGALLALLIFKKISYGGSFFVGHLIPDALKFGITGIKIRSMNPSTIIQDSLFWTLEGIASNYYFWIILGIVIFGISIYLHHLHKIKKIDVRTINRSYIFFFIGIVIHLIVDVFIIEKNYWF